MSSFSLCWSWDQALDVVHAHGISARIRMNEKNSSKGIPGNQNWHAHCQATEKNKKGNKIGSGSLDCSERKLWGRQPLSFEKRSGTLSGERSCPARNLVSSNCGLLVVVLSGHGGAHRNTNSPHFVLYRSGKLQFVVAWGSFELCRTPRSRLEFV